jgi:hypothetical protein
MVAVTLYQQNMVCGYGGASYRHELERVRCSLRRDPVLPAHERYLHTLARISRNKEAAERPVRCFYTKGMALFTAMTPSPLAFGKLPAPACAEASGRALSVTVLCPTCRAAPDPSASGAIITACFDMTSLAGGLTDEVLREKLQPEQQRIVVRSFLICRILFQNQVSRSCISRAREGTLGPGVLPLAGVGKTGACVVVGYNLGGQPAIRTCDAAHPVRWGRCAGI